jgi:hypothetical protein
LGWRYNLSLRSHVSLQIFDKWFYAWSIITIIIHEFVPMCINVYDYLLCFIIYVVLLFIGKCCVLWEYIVVRKYVLGKNVLLCYELWLYVSVDDYISINLICS